MYEHWQYELLIKKTSRSPLNPKYGHPLYWGLLVGSVVARTCFGMENAGLVALAVLFIYPYYLVQLLMRSKMQEHQMQAKARGVLPTYVPSDARGWAAVYIGGFLSFGSVMMGLDWLCQRLLGLLG
jgi:hypothetical protein